MSPGVWARRAAGLCVVLLSALPLHRLLRPDRTGPWAAQALDRAELSWGLTAWGTLTVALIAVVATVLRRRSLRGSAAGESGGHGVTHGLLAGVGRVLERPTPAAFAWTVGLAAGAVAGLVTVALTRGLLGNVDEMASVIHARYLAAGHLGGMLPASGEAWLIPNMLEVEAGWVSQYPPGHLLVLAAFVAVGARAAAGPVLIALMVGLAAAAFQRLLPEAGRPQARVAALLLALSPFTALLASGALSHLTAGAAGAAALWCALRARAGARAWAAAAGAAVGLMVLARPWTGLLLGPALTLGVWAEHGGVRDVRRLVGAWLVGGLPCAAVLLAFNAALFGGPLTLGYEALYGPAHGLGLHVDPWSFPYGLREAIGYTAADLLEFGPALLDTPISLTLVAGGYLLLASRLERGARVIAAWALLPLAGNAAYWFHQPRMLFESAPAWILLSVLGVTALLRRSGPALRTGVGVAVAVALLVGWTMLVPARLRGHAWADETLARITVPSGLPDDALVFVHASWNERIAARLQGTGMRNDSIQAVLRRNDACALHEYAAARASGASTLPPIDLVQTASRPTGLEVVSVGGGLTVSRMRGAAWSEACLREVAADRFGSVALAPLLWQGDLPGLEDGTPMFVRDQGPGANAVIRASFPGRTAWVFGHPREGASPSPIPYDEGMRLLWGVGP